MYYDGDTVLTPKIAKGSIVFLNKAKCEFDIKYLPN